MRNNKNNFSCFRWKKKKIHNIQFDENEEQLLLKIFPDVASLGQFCNITQFPEFHL